LSSELSILEPKTEKDQIYKISLLEPGRPPNPLMDIDFRELTCVYGKETEIECRLKKILSTTESTSAFIDDLDFIQSETLTYNTYSIAIQIREKSELIYEYKKILKDDIIKNITNDKSLVDELMEVFISTEIGQMRGATTTDMMTKIRKYTPEIQRTIYDFIGHYGLDPVFYIQKFRRGFKGLTENADLIHRKEIIRLEEEEKREKKQLAELKRKKEEYEKIRRNYLIAAGEVAIIASTRQLEKLQRRSDNNLKENHRKKFETILHEIKSNRFHNPLTENALFEFPSGENNPETNQNKINRNYRETVRLNPNINSRVMANIQRFKQSRTTKKPKKRRTPKYKKQNSDSPESNNNGLDRLAKSSRSGRM
jgi:hypothetical protein